MSGLNDPERQKFVGERLVDRPMDAAEITYWQDMFLGWEDKLDAGTETDQGRARWVDFMRRRLWAGDVNAVELAGAMRHQFIMEAWDKEHREPPPLEAINWHTGEIKPYFRPAD